MRFIQENPEATRLQRLGLDAEIDHRDYSAAHNYFDLALAELPTGTESTDVQVQKSRITRDDGFTSVREAIANGQEIDLDNGRSRLLKAIGYTGAFVSGEAEMKFEAAGPHETPKRPRRELFAEHGATLSLLGRLGTVKSVVFGKSADVPDSRSATYYGLAHDILRLGSNGYYRTSNAMNGARQERINGGRLPHTAVWLGRAGFALAWTAVRDRGNLTPAVGTFASRLRDLRSVASARQSVLDRP